VYPWYLFGTGFNFLDFKFLRCWITQWAHWHM